MIAESLGIVSFLKTCIRSKGHKPSGASSRNVVKVMTRFVLVTLFLVGLVVLFRRETLRQRILESFVLFVNLALFHDVGRFAVDPRAVDAGRMRFVVFWSFGALDLPRT